MNEELFFLLNGETRETLRLGMIIPCKLLHIAGDYVKVQLHSGIRAELRKENLPDYMVEDKGQYLKANGFPRGLTVNAKIVAFSPDRFNRYVVNLACHDKAMIDVSLCFNRAAIPVYTNIKSVIIDSKARIDKLLNRLPVSEEDVVAEKERERLAAVSAGVKMRKKRQIAHPAFYNVNLKTCLQLLKEMPVGDVVIRPGSTHVDHLTLSWKMLDGVYRHFDIEEKDKPSDARLGAKLIIKDEVYETIDELIARFVDPMNQLVEEIIHHKYFKTGQTEDIRADLVREKQQHPNRIPYAIHVYNKYPGCFSISYVGRTNPHSWHMEVKSSGLRFFGDIESTILPTLNQAIAFFKIKATEPRSSASRAPPQREPATFRSNAPPFRELQPQSSDRHHQSSSSNYGRDSNANGSGRYSNHNSSHFGNNSSYDRSRDRGGHPSGWRSHEDSSRGSDSRYRSDKRSDSRNPDRRW